MPHIRVEYSSNLQDSIDIPGLLSSLHKCAIATGVFPAGGTRTRAVRVDQYCIADGHPDNGFVHVSVQMGHGRDLDTRKRVGEQLFAALTQFLATAYIEHPLALSLEIQELDPLLNFKKNNLHEYVAQRHHASAAD
jgi:5-carboxymethyl-2-hydroxymuconate isomerase